MANDIAVAPMPAAQYVRMSTDHQKYSIANQSVTNHAYAALHKMEVVRTYADEGRSGLSLDGRAGLKQLIADVQSRRADFKAILVFDVSRWGRFPDPDEAAHYEYICKCAGISVHYCAEQFFNDGTPFSAIVKGLKRAMAAEYSRELSVKVFAGQKRVLELGYKPGGSAPYGLRRLLRDEQGVAKGILAKGQRKSIARDRVVLVPGPKDEIAVIRKIFNAFVHKSHSKLEIARNLNCEHIPNVSGHRWASACVHRVLTNENYIGNLVWNRVSLKLKSQLVRNDPEKWIRVSDVLAPVISRALFDAAQTKLNKPKAVPTQQERLQPLRRLYEKHGYLSTRLIDRSPGVPSAASYGRWFKSLIVAYRLVGYTARSGTRRSKAPPRGAVQSMSNVELLERLRQVFLARGYLTQEIIDGTPEIPCACTYRKRFGSLTRAYQMIGYVTTRQQRRNGSAIPTQRLSNNELLEALRRLCKRRRRLSQDIINQSVDNPCSSTYRRRFGSLERAYELIGWRIRRCYSRKRLQSDDQLLSALRGLLRRAGHLNRVLINDTENMPSANVYLRRFGSLSRAYQLIGYTPRHGRAP